MTRAATVGRYAIFTRGRNRVMHAVAPDARVTCCGLPIGIGSGLVRDGNYGGAKPCARCWSKP